MSGIWQKSKLSDIILCKMYEVCDNCQCVDNCQSCFAGRVSQTHCSVISSHAHVKAVNRSRPKLNYGAARDFRVGNSEPCGNNRSFPETRERDRVPVT